MIGLAPFFASIAESPGMYLSRSVTFVEWTLAWVFVTLTCVVLGVTFWWVVLKAWAHGRAMTYERTRADPVHARGGGMREGKRIRLEDLKPCQHCGDALVPLVHRVHKLNDPDGPETKIVWQHLERTPDGGAEFWAHTFCRSDVQPKRLAGEPEDA